MAAVLLAKLCAPRSGNLQIELVESDAIATIGVGEATIPAIKQFNRLAGLSETEFLRATQATFKLGIEFSGWGAPDQAYIHGFGKIGQDMGWLRLHAYWLKMRGTGRVSDRFADYSINTAAACQNRFTVPRPDLTKSPLREIAYAYHFDAALYARFLRRHAEALGVTRTEGTVREVGLHAENGFVERLVLENGAVVSGDLFLDCTGMRGLLIEKTLKTGFEDWSHWLPCDRAVAAPCAYGGDKRTQMTPYTRSIARPAGWQWRIPLQHRIGNGHVYASRHMSDDEACAILMRHLDGEALAEPHLIPFRTGRRLKMWSRNVVAIGLAGGFMDPLESTSIHLVQSGLLRLISLFPDSGFSETARDAYNAHSRFEYERIRDFLIAHYHLNGRDEPMWRACRGMTIPESLKARLDLFRASGRFFKDADELFADESWIQVLLGQGLIPEAYDPFVDLYDEAAIMSYLNNIRDVIRSCVAGMSNHADYIAAHCAAETETTSCA
jgi:tryptophan halogenase